jgi:hypothetical protein
MNKAISYLHFGFLFLLLNLSAVEAQESQKRLVRLESRIYGWYAIADPSFDKTIGRRELFKIRGSDQFLKGLAGRLVLLDGVFSDGSLHLPALAPPPVSMPEDTVRQSFILTLKGDDQSLLSESGFEFVDRELQLSSLKSGRWKLDLLTAPTDTPNILALLHILDSEPLTWSKAIEPSSADLDSPALVDLTLTQDLLDSLTNIGLARANLRVSYQGLNLALTNLAIKLPDGSISVAQPWSLQGTVDLNFGGDTSLAESSFVVSAQPLIEDDHVKLKPDWENIQIEGQLPFAFVLGSNTLGRYVRYLPAKVTLFDLGIATDRLRADRLLNPEAQPEWYLGSPAPGSVRIALGEHEVGLPHRDQVKPGLFRLVLGQKVVDRMMKRQVRQMLSPTEPYRPDPPVEVGKALFVPILVKEIYIRNLEAGYRQSVLRFDDLIIDVGWEAGPFSGVDPLLKTSGYVRPKLVNDGQERYWSWDVVLQELEVTSEKIPGDQEKLAQEFKPKIEEALGARLAQKNRFSNRILLSKFLSGTQGELEVTSLRALDKSLTLEGRVNL